MTPVTVPRDRSPRERGNGAQSDGPAHDRPPGTVGHSRAQSPTSNNDHKHSAKYHALMAALYDRER